MKKLLSFLVVIIGGFAFVFLTNEQTDKTNDIKQNADVENVVKHEKQIVNPIKKIKKVQVSSMKKHNDETISEISKNKEYLQYRKNNYIVKNYSVDAYNKHKVQQILRHQGGVKSKLREIKQHKENEYKKHYILAHQQSKHMDNFTHNIKTQRRVQQMQSLQQKMRLNQKYKQGEQK